MGRLRNLMRGTDDELGAIGGLENSFGGLSIVDDNSHAPRMSAAAAYELIGGDTDPHRIRSIVGLTRKRDRRTLLRQLGADALSGPNGREAA